jgi:hypothetical protein
MQICAALEVTPEYLLSGVCEDSNRGKSTDYMVIPKGTDERKLLEFFNDMPWMERTHLLSYAEKLSHKGSSYKTRNKKNMKKIAEFCDVEVFMDSDFTGRPSVDLNYLDDDVQGRIDLERGAVEGDFSGYVLPVIEVWLNEHRERLLKMWETKTISLLPAWE